MDEQELKTLILNIRSTFDRFEMSGLEREHLTNKLQKIETLFKATQDNKKTR